MMRRAELVAGCDRSAWMGAVYLVAWEPCVGRTFTVGNVELVGLVRLGAVCGSCTLVGYFPF